MRGRLQWLSAPLKVVPAATTMTATAMETGAPRPPRPAAISEKNSSGEGKQGGLAGGDLDGTATQVEMDAPPGASKKGRTFEAPALVVMAVMMASVAVAVVLMRAKGMRLRGCASAMVRKREYALAAGLAERSMMG